MKSILSAMALVGFSVSQAQPSLTKVFDYKIGDNIKYLDCDTSARLNYVDTGTGKTWQFSGLSVVDSASISIAQTSAGSYGNQFSNASYVMQYSDGSEIYIQSTAKAAYTVGASKSGQLVSYPNAMLCAGNPFSYKDVQCDTFTTAGTVSNLHLSGIGYTTMTGEASGTLVLPNGTYTDVLKIKTVTTEFDTLTNLPAPNVITTTEVSYSWYDAAHPAALLTIDSVNLTSPFQDYQTKNIAYLQAFKSTGIAEMQQLQNTMACYLDNNGLVLYANMVQGHKYSLKLFNSMGQLVMQDNFIAVANGHSFSCPDLQNGMYIAVLADENGSAVCKVVK